MKGTFKSLILVFVLVLAFVGTGAGEEKQVGQIEKKYPPYPDVWDFKVLTKEEVSKGIWTTRPAKLPDGDYVFIKLQEEGKGKQSKIKVVGCVTMFGRSELPIEECKKIYKNVSLCRKTKNPNYCIYMPKYLEIDEITAKYATYPGPVYPLKYEDGTIIERKSLWLGNCAPIFNNRLVVYKYENGKKVVLKEVVPVQLLDKPKKEEVNTKCERNWDYKGKYMITRVEPRVGIGYILDDGTTFNLFYIGGEEYAIRFDKNLNSKSKFFNTKIFFIDAEEFGKYKLGEGDDQQVVNKVYNYIKSKYLKTSEGG